MPAEIVFRAAGHIRFGLGGQPADILATPTDNTYLPTISIPFNTPLTFYRKIYIDNNSSYPYYKWEVEVKSDLPDVLSVLIGYDPNPFSTEALNATDPFIQINATKTIIKSTDPDVNNILLDVNEIVGFWLKFTAQPNISKYTQYSITITFRGIG